MIYHLQNLDTTEYTIWINTKPALIAMIAQLRAAGETLLTTYLQSYVDSYSSLMNYGMENIFDAEDFTPIPLLLDTDEGMIGMLINNVIRFINENAEQINITSKDFRQQLEMKIYENLIRENIECFRFSETGEELTTVTLAI